MKRTWRATASVLIVGILLGLFIRLGYVVADGLREPWVYLGVEVQTPVIKPGDKLRVVYNLDRRRVCRTRIAQFWIDTRTGQAVERGAAPGGYGALGQHKTLVVLSPPPLPPGRYAYRAVMESDCGLAEFTTPVPDAEFEVAASH